MEAAPLTLAHTHARNASIETKKSNPVAASEEHDLAAAEFATAAESSNDSEAIRILNLLEQEHRKLGQIIKFRHERPAEDTDTQPTPRETRQVVSSTDSAKQPDTRSASPDASTRPPRLAGVRRSTARDLSSSIASNLASARGIPNTRQKRPSHISPIVSNQHADGHFSQADSKRQTPESPAIGQRPSWAPPLEQAEDSPPSTHADTIDTPFQTFYTTFEGLMSKLGAPLAFASTALAPAIASKEDTAATTSAKTPKSPKQPEPSASLDYSQLISRAALRAVNSNTPGTYPSNPSESFYVVPTTGGTISYAEIMNRADREEARTLRGHHRYASNLSNINEDSFVDARSTILPDRGGSSSSSARHAANVTSFPSGNRRATTNEPKVAGKTMEELALENETLRHVSDNLSRRLHVFEMSSQTSTAALAQSIRSLPRSPLATPEHSRKTLSHNAGAGDNHDMRSKSGKEGTSTRSIDELEEILRKSDAKAYKREEENAKLRETLVRYREKWDNLKANAKTRRDGLGGRDRRDDG